MSISKKIIVLTTLIFIIVSILLLISCYLDPNDKATSSTEEEKSLTKEVETNKLKEEVSEEEVVINSADYNTYNVVDTEHC
ncbi:MAG: hypothetical protein MUO60_04165 [Clostridiaceae bacterium]|nr:hypothetical protein [Clostridiaceae bacterium]